MAATEKKSASFVTVGCKLPAGLILRVFDMVDGQEPVLGGGMRAVKVAAERPERFFINGNAHPQNAAPTCEIVDGYAITKNVPKDLWNKWLEHNSKSLLVTSKMIIAHDQKDSVEDMAHDLTDVKSGLERIDPAKHPKGITKADLKQAA